MNPSRWHWISASVRGTSHLSSGTECQDSHFCAQIPSSEGEILVALVSDGAGSAKRSAIGSQMICEVMHEQAEQYFAEQGQLSQINRRLIANWIELFRNEVILRADGEGVSDRDFACTLLGVLVGPNSAVMFQIGDGAIVYSPSPATPYKLAFWPERGEYENTTYFATQPTFLEQLQFSLLDEQVAEVALLSDGIQRLALNYQTREPHQPFFAGFFPTLRSTAAGDLRSISDKLAEYLDSPKINERTDDDKTLVLAVADTSTEAVSRASGTRQ
jgi:hypothetical protein